jgi:ribose-phosphate pyrophosphokinase
VAYCKGDLQIFSGSASQQLTESICKHLKKKPGGLESKRFSDSETWVKVNENVRGADVFVVQSTSTPANEHLMELFLIIDAMKRASAERITAVIPYLGYARQDRKDQGRVALSAKLIANLITQAGADRVLTIDLHAGQLQGFFDIPVDHLSASPILVNYVKGLNLENFIVVSPDVGNVKKARSFAQRLNTELAIVDKRRPHPNVAEVMNIIGDIDGHNVFMFDDMIDTAGTIVNASVALKERGAQEIYCCCTHPVFSGKAIERIKDSPINEVVVTDTISIADKEKVDKINVISVSKLFAEAIKRIHNHLSLSELFDEPVLKP